MLDADSVVQRFVETAGFDIRVKESKDALGAQLIETAQAETNVYHRFGGGLYIREAHYVRGTLIIGAEHVSEHMNVLLKGSIMVVDSNNAIQTLVAPHMFVAKAGSKIGYALEDVVWQNIYVTSNTNVEELEKELFKTPEYFKKHQEQRLAAMQESCQADRDDFQLMVQQAGWVESDVLAVSHYREDCVPFPEGSYCVQSSDSPIEGKGLFATAEIKVDTIIAPMRLRGFRTPAGYLVNHSKTPNTFAFKDEHGDMFLIANRDIQGMRGGDLGEELTLDYRQVMLINNLWKGVQTCLPQ